MSSKKNASRFGSPKSTGTKGINVLANRTIEGYILGWKHRFMCPTCEELLIAIYNARKAALLAEPDLAHCRSEELKAQMEAWDKAIHYHRQAIIEYAVHRASHQPSPMHFVAKRQI